MRCYNILLLLMILSIGCSTTSGGKSARGNRNLIFAEEIERSAANLTTAYDVIRLLRPYLLESTTRRNVALGALTEDGKRIPIVDSVYLDGAYLGKVQSLETIPSDFIAEIQYLKPTDSHARYGLSTGGGGVFLITTK